MIDTEYEGMETEEKMFYTAPTTAVFNDAKKQARRLCKEIARDSNEEHIKEKLSRVKKLDNYGSNFTVFFSMLDPDNKMLLFHRLKKETKDAVQERGLV